MQNQYRLAQEMQFACCKTGNKGKLLARILQQRKAALSKGPCDVKGLINQNHGSVIDMVAYDQSNASQRNLIGAFTNI